MEYFMTGHKAELLNKDQPNLKDVIIANAGEDVTKEPWRDKVYRASKRGHTQFTLGMASRDVPITQTKEDIKAFLKAASACDPSSFATLYRLGVGGVWGGGYGDTQV